MNRIINEVLPPLCYDYYKGLNNQSAETGQYVIMETFKEKKYFEYEEDEVGATLKSKSGSYGGGSENICLWDGSQTAPTLTKNNAGGTQRMPDKDNFNCVVGVDTYNQSQTGEVSKTMSNKATDSDHIPCVEKNYTVRRLTPVECTRLQGYPDWWCYIGEEVIEDVKDYEYILNEEEYLKNRPKLEDYVKDASKYPSDLVFETENDIQDIVDEEDKDWFAFFKADVKARSKATEKKLVGTHKEKVRYWTDSKGKKHKLSDSQIYKALGNSICLPYWKWIIKRISANYERDATMCSLFDGIGGFPLLWEQINGRGTAVWASEIEEFPMAVTRERFPEPEQTVRGGEKTCGCGLNAENVGGTLTTSLTSPTGKTQDNSIITEET